MVGYLSEEECCRGLGGVVLSWCFGDGVRWCHGVTVYWEYLSQSPGIWHMGCTLWLVAHSLHAVLWRSGVLENLVGVLEKGHFVEDQP